MSATRLPLSALYGKDETAWLDAMAALAAAERTSEMDFVNLSEYLSSMAKRDFREVKRRLVVLLLHLLKWRCQPGFQSESWLDTIREQRSELNQLLESGTLRNHAVTIYDQAYETARTKAFAETGMSMDTFPEKAIWSLDAVLDENGVSLPV